MRRLYSRDESGVAATEFALMLPVLLLMLIGVFDFGMYLNSQLRLENTALAAAQYLIQGGDEDNLQEDILLAGNLGLSEEDLEDLDWDVEWIYECSDGLEVGAGSECAEGDYLREYVEVTISVEYETVMPLPNLIDSINLSGRVRLQKG